MMAAFELGLPSRRRNETSPSLLHRRRPRSLDLCMLASRIRPIALVPGSADGKVFQDICSRHSSSRALFRPNSNHLRSPKDSRQPASASKAVRASDAMAVGSSRTQPATVDAADAAVKVVV